MLPTMLRERTTMPRTTPRFRMTRACGSSNVVVTSVESMGTRSPLKKVGCKLFYFAPDWTPHYMSLSGVPLVGRGDLLMPYRPAFKMALRPVFAQLGVEGEAPASQWTAIVVLLAVSIVVIVGIIGFIVWSS